MWQKKYEETFQNVAKEMLVGKEILSFSYASIIFMTGLSFINCVFSRFDILYYDFK